MREVISAHQLTKTYGTLTAVDHIDFSVSEGELFGFLGPNGAGKTTTIKMLTTLLAPTSGSVRLNSFDPSQNALEARRSFGIVFQDPSVDDELTAWENLELHGELYSVPHPLLLQRSEELLRYVDLWDRKDDFVKHFSGGMKRRLEIARALLHQPRIIFLDEPTVGLDPQTRSHIWSYILKLAKEQKITVFFTTHYMEEAERVSSRVAIIDHGKIAALGTPSELKERTKTNTLEEAFLKLTGHDIRAEKAAGIDHLRTAARMWRGKK